jgi:hypothetical protein
MDSSLERVEDLLIKRSLEGLSDAENAELRALVETFPNVSIAEFDRTVAAISVSSVPTTCPMPSELYAQIEAAGKRLVSERAAAALATSAPARAAMASATSAPARAAFVRRRRSESRPVRRFPSRPSVVPWIVAVASIVLAVVGWWPTQPSTSSPDLLERRQLLIAAGAQQQQWSATADPTAVVASGDVVWDAASQQGFMRILMLSPNDPAEYQYQLWIFDADRDERFPVDGGVFDIAAGDGEVIVPISAKLPVGRPVLFAITVEKPGGVVVSDRKRIALLAEFS